MLFYLFIKHLLFFFTHERLKLFEERSGACLRFRARAGEDFVRAFASRTFDAQFF